MSKIGDALIEVNTGFGSVIGSSGGDYFFGDLSMLMYPSKPFFERCGESTGKNISGLFDCRNYSNGSAYTNYGFRLVLAH